MKFREMLKLWDESPGFRKGIDTMDKEYEKLYGRPTMFTQMRQKQAMHSKTTRILDNMEAATDRLMAAKKQYAAQEEAQRAEDIKALENG